VLDSNRSSRLAQPRAGDQKAAARLGQHHCQVKYLCAVCTKSSHECLMNVYERNAAQHSIKETSHCKTHEACVYRVLDFQNHHKQRPSQEVAPSLHSRLLSQKEVVHHDKLRTDSSLHLPMASWSPTSTLRAQPASRLQVAGNISVMQDALLLPCAACDHAQSFCSFGVAQPVHINSSNCYKVLTSQTDCLLVACRYTKPCCWHLYGV